MYHIKMGLHGTGWEVWIGGIMIWHGIAFTLVLRRIKGGIT